MVHSNQALLEVLWLGIVDTYFILLRPAAFRMNEAMFLGKIPRHSYAEEHALELTALEGHRHGGGQIRGTEHAASRGHRNSTGG